MEKDKERREKDRKDRELPRLEDTGPSRYYRQHTASTPRTSQLISTMTVQFNAVVQNIYRLHLPRSPLPPGLRLILLHLMQF